MTTPAIRRALISVSDKTGIVELARALAGRGIELVSTGGTAALLRGEGLAVTDVAEITAVPEMMDGRLKTLHPRIHGGLLGRRADPEHRRAMAEHGIPAIDLLIVNLYPFAATVASGAGEDDCVENIDIGGPAMIRAAAKNYHDVTVIVSPDDYHPLLAELAAQGGATGLDFRRRRAAAAYAHTAAYDSTVAQWFAERIGDPMPEIVTFSGRRRQLMRYGENPHQSAALYASGHTLSGLAGARQLQGKELSFNNIADTDAALDLVGEFAGGEAAAVAIIKHANPCGVAVGSDLATAYRKALACDPVSAFGGIVALSRPLDAAAASEIARIFTEVIVAPGASDEAREIIARKPNLRLLLVDPLPDSARHDRIVKSVAGGFLVQSRDASVFADEPRVVTKRRPTAEETANLRFAFTVAKHVKSNAIVYARGGATVGIGAGQMSRIDSARIAARKAEDAAAAAGLAVPATRGSVVASDAFFPFPDGLLVAIEAGATAVIQPGGSIKDADVIAAADDAGIAMVLTGTRHFRH
jgi:phosphoribosylaminoimidazolecarboxamide formyltransferase/IMP cyclohydrolase